MKVQLCRYIRTHEFEWWVVYVDVSGEKFIIDKLYIEFKASEITMYVLTNDKNRVTTEEYRDIIKGLIHDLCDDFSIIPVVFKKDILDVNEDDLFNNSVYAEKHTGRK